MAVRKIRQLLRGDKLAGVLGNDWKPHIRGMTANYEKIFPQLKLVRLGLPAKRPMPLSIAAPPDVWTVRAVRKTSQHRRFSEQPSPIGYTVSSSRGLFREGATITLKYNRPTKFVINAPGHPFYITSDRSGGSRRMVGNMVERRRGTAMGTFVVTPRWDFEFIDSERRALERGERVYLYYMCNYNRNMGGWLVVDPRL